MTTGIKYHSVTIQNLNTATVMDRIHKTKSVWNTRRTVTIVLYRKWRVRARRRSMDTAAKVAKDTPEAIQLDMDRRVLNVQCALKFSTSSTILKATKIGWHIKPTRRSEAARQPKRIKDGLWRSGVFRIAKRIKMFPTHVIRENGKFRIHVTIFVTKTPSVYSKWLSLRKKHVLWGLFMMMKSVCRWGRHKVCSWCRNPFVCKQDEATRKRNWISGTEPNLNTSLSTSVLRKRLNYS